MYYQFNIFWKGEKGQHYNNNIISLDKRFFMIGIQKNI